MKSISSSAIPVTSANRVMPYALSTPLRVMSTLVDPPERTSSSGRRGATASRRAAFFSPVGSQARLASRGASCPRAEKVIWLPRSSRISPQVRSSHRPSLRAWASTISKPVRICSGVRSLA